MKNTSETAASPLTFFNAPGEMSKRCREFDWTATPLGPPELWDIHLRSTTNLILQSAFPCFLLWGKDKTLIYNDAYIKMLVRKHPAALGVGFFDVWPETKTALAPIMAEVFEGRAQYYEDLELKLDRTGSLQEAYFTFSYSALQNDAGKIEGLFCCAVETTDAVRARRETEKSQAQLTAVLEAMSEGFFSIDKDWIVTRVNTNHEIFSAKTRNEQIGKSLIDLFFSAPEYRESLYMKSYSKAMIERVPVHFEDFYAPLDLWTRVSVYPQPDGGLAVFFKRINEEKKAQQDLIDAKDEAERANYLKSAFLANMSHEIRTPLGAMMGFADLLRDPGIRDAEKANYIDILHRNGNQLGHVINDILDLSKVETGHINFEYLRVRPLQVAHEVVSLMSVLAKEKDLVLSFADDGTTPNEIVTDPTRMRQVLINLVNNALKFTKVGSIEIKLSGHEGTDGETCCAFEVHDTGIGVPEKAKEKLFQMFSQADNSMTRRFGGTGLGLALSRSLARAMGGDVKLVESARDRGSVFRFSIESREHLLPKETPERTEAIRKSEEPLAIDTLNGIRILLVEDSPDNQKLIWRYLSKYGARVEIADNGLEGVKKALASEHDIVLMDLQMPVMDGYAATGKLRSRGYSKPIIALTAHAMADVRKKCQDVGCNDHLPKPINPQDLVLAIRRLTRI